MQTISHLALQPVIKTRPAGGFEQALAQATLRRVEAREFVFAEGDPVSHLFRVETGAVALYRVTADGRRQIVGFAYPGDFIGLGRTLGLSDLKILMKIVVPSAFPGIWDTLRISLGWAWTWVVVAELVAATSGLGYRITVSQRYFQTDTIIGYILFLGVLGLITDQLMKAGERLLFRDNQRHGT